MARNKQVSVLLKKVSSANRHYMNVPIKIFNLHVNSLKSGNSITPVKIFPGRYTNVFGDFAVKSGLSPWESEPGITEKYCTFSYRVWYTTPTTEVDEVKIGRTRRKQSALLGERSK